MKDIVFVIDNLDSGGAERQVFVLANGFHSLGFNVLVMTYCPESFYIQDKQAIGFEYKYIEASSKLDRILKFRREIRTRKPDAVIAFLQTSSVLAELASFPFHKWKLVVSERSFLGNHISFRSRLIQWLHSLSDYVVTNSHRNAAAILKTNVLLKKKIKVIYNAVDINHFIPDRQRIHPGKPFKIICVGTHTYNKNAKGLIKALSLISPDDRPFVTWIGRKQNIVEIDNAAYQEACNTIKELNLDHWIVFRNPTNNLVEEYQNSDAIVLPSFIEGLPNVVCEAMSCGLPVLMGKEVSDSKNFISDGVNGWLFDPNDPESIAESIRKASSINAETWNSIQSCNRRKAEELFNEKNIIQAFLKIVV